MEHMDVIGPLLPAKYSPLQASGAGLQSVYLAEISQELADTLIDIAGAEYPEDALSGPDPDAEAAAEEERELANIQGRADIGEVERKQLVKARRGQGIFRTNVRMNEFRCRVTGITDKGHLRASHIKPWKDCTDEEKIHGCNGLLLAPHIDHLFDRGWISFTDGGDLLVASGMNLDVLHAWDVSETLNVGDFSPKQAEFLAHHRAKVFRDRALIASALV
jgi:predicted restriction endonuclease